MFSVPESVPVTGADPGLPAATPLGAAMSLRLLAAGPACWGACRFRGFLVSLFCCFRGPVPWGGPSRLPVLGQVITALAAWRTAVRASGREGISEAG